MLLSFFRRRKALFFRFVDKRIPVAKQFYLSQKNLFIFPTKRGFQFLLLVLVLWMLGTNYQNNLILALAFFMVSLFVLVILVTFQNLNRLTIQYVHANEAFAGDELALTFSIDNRSRTWREELRFLWQGSSSANACFYSCKPNVEQKISVPVMVKKRGVLRLPRMGVQSIFPFGIIQCWTWLSWDVDAVVYPKPKSGLLGNSLKTADEAGDGLHPTKGNDDFSGLKEYAAGDSLGRISWKTFAKRRGLFVKSFEESLSAEKWLDFSVVAGANTEEKLSILCFWVLHYHQENENYGLLLPNKTIAPGSGLKHRTACLKALALY